MKLLVTGGAGYIGSHTAHQLVDVGHQVTILDNFYSGHRWAVPEKAQLVEGDVGNRELLARVLSDQKFDGVLHFAAHIEVGESVRNPLKYYKNNTLNSLTLFEECLKAGVRKVVFSSTAAVYGEPTSLEPISESAPLKPMNPYGASKLMTEKMLQDLAESSGGELRYVILRYFNAAGARRDLKVGQSTPRATHLIKTLSEVATGARESITIFGTDYPTKDGTCMRDYIHIEDLAQAHLDALKYLEGGGSSDVFNVGYGKSSSILEVINAFESAAGIKIKSQKGSRREGDPSSLAADNTKIREKLGWQPRHNDLELICKTALDWERKLIELRKKSSS